MKKIITLLFIFIFAAVSNAALTSISLSVDKTSVSQGQSAVIDVISSNTNTGVAFLDIGPISNNYSLTPVPGWVMPDWCDYEKYEFDGNWEYMIIVARSPAGGDITPGIIFSVNLTNLVGAAPDVTVTLYNDAIDLVGAETIHLIPEPASALLLIFGAGLIKHRKSKNRRN